MAREQRSLKRYHRNRVLQRENLFRQRRNSLHAVRERIRSRSRAMPQVALVTGAGRGIGRDIAQRMAKEGYAVGLIARTKSQLDETADLIRAGGGKAVVTPTDVSRREQVVAAVATVERELGPISVLINNAGAYLRKRFSEISEEDFDFQLKVNA